MSATPIYSDFSDTMVVSVDGGVIEPFEIQFMRIVSDRIENVEVRHDFEKQSKEAYEQFMSIKRDRNIKFEERMKVWLKPFYGLLTIEDIQKVARNIKWNRNFIEGIKLLKKYSGINNINITVVSGSVSQHINEYLTMGDTKKEIADLGIKWDIKATELIMINGVYSGEVMSVDPIVAEASLEVFPKDFIIFGDDNMAKWDFGDKLLNVQSFDSAEVDRKIKELYHD